MSGGYIRPAAEVDAEIEKLKGMRDSVRKYTAFGDDNHAAIDAQIQVLEEGMDENDIYTSWPSEADAEEDEDVEADQHAHDAAMDARRWLTTASEEAPSEGWAELVQD